MDIDDVLLLDESVMPLLRRWAADRYGYAAASIDAVRFDFHKGYGGGCETCGYGADEDSLECRVTFKDGTQPLVKDESYSTNLIRDILKFAAGN